MHVVTDSYDKALELFNDVTTAIQHIPQVTTASSPASVNTRCFNAQTV